jgi:A/G-specific adenine glycosylase
VRTRPAKGLLGGMTEVPTGAWTHDFDADAALAEAPAIARARWERVPGVVTHVFTHFPLELAVHLARVAASAKAPAGMRWIAMSEIADAAFPNVMRKVITHALRDGGRALKPK